MIKWTVYLMYIRDQWFWQNFINSMCDIKFWKDIENLRSQNFERFLPFLTFFSSQKSSLSLVASKNPSFRTNFKNVHMTLVKSAPKKSFSQKNQFFWAKLFLGALFTKVMCTFLKSVWKNGFFDTPFDLIKEKKFSPHSRVSVYFLWSKKPKIEATTQYFGKWFFINRS